MPSLSGDSSAGAQKRGAIGPNEPSETREQKIQKIAVDAEGPSYHHAGPGGSKASEAQLAAYGQAAQAYAAFAAQAQAQAKAAQEAAGYYARLSSASDQKLLLEGITKKAAGEGNKTAAESGKPKHEPKNVKVLKASSDTEMQATWFTGEEAEEADPASEAYWGTDPKELKSYATGKIEKDEKTGGHKHSVLMQGLYTQTRYFFMVGNRKNGFSAVFRFKTEGKNMPMPSAPQTKSGWSKATPDPVGPVGDVPSAGRGQFAEERRLDPADGNAYTQREFQAQYKGLREWENARRLGAAPAPKMVGNGVSVPGVVPPPSAGMWGGPPMSAPPPLGAKGGKGVAGVRTPAAPAAPSPPGAAPAAPQLKRPPAEVERRYDYQCPDGKVYTQDEFKRQYGNDDAWKAAPRLHEKRLDAADGKPYTYAEFRVQYGAAAKEKWQAAKPAGASTTAAGAAAGTAAPKFSGPLVRLKNFGRKPPNGACAFFAKRLKGFKASCMPDPTKVVELPSGHDEELLMAPGTQVAADGMLEMINVAKDFNTQLFPNLAAVIETQEAPLE